MAARKMTIGRVPLHHGSLKNARKALGIRRETSKDTFYFQPKEIIAEALIAEGVTQRTISKQSSKVFDPLGFVNPVNR